MRTLTTAAAAFTAAALTFTLTACGTGNDDDADRGAISLQNCGRTVTLDAPATRALTVNQGATESALAVGAQDDLIGTAYLDDQIAPRFKEAYDAIPVIAPKYPDLETVISKKPDLVAASYGSAFAEDGIGTRDELANLDIATYVSPFGCENKADRPAASWDAIADEVSDYGTLFGRSDAADDVNQKMRDTLAELKEKQAGKDTTIMWWDAETEAPSVGGKSGGPQLIIDAVGATNVFGDLDGNWADTSWEQVIKADPDVIVLIDANFSTAESKRQYIENDPALQGLTAVKNKSYIVIPFSESTPGARTIDGAVTLSEALEKR
ncbi:iron ABC transporter substrate-binding protein [Gordonia iterans]|uniref:Iron ABC transporter substrate-binding protein n=1 Tax=Gordonia iterans TaxID=1004901 RepID=A0A2S0KE88_9ACTN|nr:ABC transporter substrate-binding protein [Gordonia iterans]AVL99992.1 iron ABC transporter substrate-binding protein [Gordonia iterans]